MKNVVWIAGVELQSPEKSAPKPKMHKSHHLKTNKAKKKKKHTKRRNVLSQKDTSHIRKNVVGKQHHYQHH